MHTWYANDIAWNLSCESSVLSSLFLSGWATDFKSGKIVFKSSQILRDFWPLLSECSPNSHFPVQTKNSRLCFTDMGVPGMTADTNAIESMHFSRKQNAEKR